MSNHGDRFFIGAEILIWLVAIGLVLVIVRGLVMKFPIIFNVGAFLITFLLTFCLVAYVIGTIFMELPPAYRRWRDG